jgi:hypothetical protein
MDPRRAGPAWHAPGLTPAERLVMLALCAYADDDGGQCYPSVASVAAACGMQPRHAKAILSRLTERRLLVTEIPAHQHYAPRRRIVLPEGTLVVPSEMPEGTLVVPSDGVPAAGPEGTLHAPEGTLHAPEGTLHVVQGGRRLSPDPSVLILQPESSEEGAAGAARDPVEVFAEAWNRETTSPIARCREITSRRRQQIRARLRERSIVEWLGVFGRIERSAFCRGANDRTWVATFDWVLQPETAVKVLEGKYDTRPRTEPRPAAKPVAVGLWGAVLEKLSVQLQRREILDWFAPLRCVRDDGDRLVVCGSQDHVTWIQRHYRAQLAAALQGVRPGLELDWETREALA